MEKKRIYVVSALIAVIAFVTIPSQAKRHPVPEDYLVSGTVSNLVHRQNRSTGRVRFNARQTQGQRREGAGRVVVEFNDDKTQVLRMRITFRGNARSNTIGGTLSRTQSFNLERPVVNGFDFNDKRFTFEAE